MSDNVGLSTPRGSGTSGYVQRNLAHMRPRDRPGPYSSSSSRDAPPPKHRQRQPDRAILEHDRKREVEVKVMELRDRLEEEGGESAEEGEEPEDDDRPSSSPKANSSDKNNKAKAKKRPLSEEEIDTRCDALRRQLLDKMARGGASSSSDARSLKRHQVHELADAKIRESERLRSALRISRDYEEGSHWRRQEERLRKALERDGDDGPPDRR